MHQLKHVHPLVINLFPKGEIGNFPLPGRLQHFLENWKILANDSKILEWVSGLKIDVQEEPFQERVPHQAQMSMQESELINQEVEAMLRNGAIHLVHSKESQFLSNLFLVPKQDGGNRPVINLKALNSFTPYSGRFASVEGSSERERFYVQGGPERCLLLRSCAQESSKISSISMEGKYLQVPVSMFRSGSSTRIFTKLLKIPIAVLRRIQIRIIIYLDDMLLMSQTINGLEIARDTLIFLLESLSFVINLQKSVLVPLQKIEFLCLEIDSVRITLPQEKVKKLRLKCQSLFQTPERHYGK